MGFGRAMGGPWRWACGSGALVVLGRPVEEVKSVKRAEPRADKVARVQELQDKFQRGQGIIFADYRGLNVKQTDELRKRLRAAGVEFKVIKNSLALRAGKEAGLDLEPLLVGPTAVALGYDDPVAPAKILSDFAKETKLLEIKGGVVEGKLIDPEGVKALADLPSREQLLAMVAAGMQGPIRGMVVALGGIIRSLVYVLDAVRRQREEAGAS